jgi:hypothetical protein
MTRVRTLHTSVKAAAAFAVLLSSTSAFAQDATAPIAVAAAAPTDDTAKCELHIWPTENYIGIQTGLLSGFGAVGAVADLAAHDGRVKTTKDLMRDYLGPDVQMEELNKLGIQKTLQLQDYKVIIEAPTPFNEDMKANPELKAKVKAMNAKIKAGERLSDSKNACYAELVTTHIFYYKAMMYGSNLFTGWIYREFGDKAKATKTATGQVKNPLENFPPKTPEMADAAKTELRDAYSKDFVEYVAKKVQPGVPAAK